MRIVFCLIALLLFEPVAAELKVRPALKNETETLHTLIKELATYEGKDLATLPLTKENLMRFGFSDNPLFYTEFAEKEGIVVGYALYFYTFSANQGFPILYLEDLYVKPEFRGQGIGYQLLKKLTKYASENNCCRIEWHVFSWNKSAIDFYKKLGADLKEDFFLMRLEKESFANLP